MDGAIQLFRNLFSGTFNGKVYEIAAQLDLSELYVVRQVLDMAAPGLVNYMYLAFLLLLLVLSFFLVFGPTAYERTIRGELTSGRCWMICILLVWCIISLSQVSTFLYFNF